MMFIKGREREVLSLTTPEEHNKWGLSIWTIGPANDDDHAAVFPKELARRMILYGGDVEDVICDPFAGTGTTLQVAAEHGLRYIGIELNGRNALRASQAVQLGHATRQRHEEAVTPKQQVTQ